MAYTVFQKGKDTDAGTTGDPPVTRFQPRGDARVIAEGFETVESAVQFCRDQLTRDDSLVLYVVDGAEVILATIYDRERERAEEARREDLVSFAVYAVIVIVACYFWAPSGLALHVAIGALLVFGLAILVLGAHSNFVLGLGFLFGALVFAHAYDRWSKRPVRGGLAPSALMVTATASPAGRPDRPSGLCRRCA